MDMSLPHDESADVMLQDMMSRDVFMTTIGSKEAVALYSAIARGVDGDILMEFLSRLPSDRTFAKYLGGFVGDLCEYLHPPRWPALDFVMKLIQHRLPQDVWDEVLALLHKTAVMSFSCLLLQYLRESGLFLKCHVAKPELLHLIGNCLAVEVILFECGRDDPLDLEQRNPQGYTPLMALASRCWLFSTGTTSRALCGPVNALEVLVKAGANVETLFEDSRNKISADALLVLLRFEPDRVLAKRDMVALLRDAISGDTEYFSVYSACRLHPLFVQLTNCTGREFGSERQGSS
jgi:hypothetical protein